MDEVQVRLDKWLWAARFYKTRSLATDAIAGGKVHLNQARVKPSKRVVLGDEVRIRKGQFEWTIVVQGLSEKRGSATQAQQLYAETQASLESREVHRDLRRAHNANIIPAKKPTKKERRALEKLRRSTDG